jgi:hypothetical protein
MSGSRRRPQALHTLRCAPTYFPPSRRCPNFHNMTVHDPPGQDRRSAPRGPPRYSPEDVDRLRITRVHFREDFLFFLLSDGNMVCVPLTILPYLQTASRSTRYRWQIREDGRTVVWHTRAMGVASERLELKQILAHPEAQISELPGSR